MSGGGNKPRGGKMGTSIRADTVSKEAVTDAKKELSMLVDKLNAIRRKIADSIQSYQSLDKAIQHLEMELAKSQKEIDSLNTQNDYLKNQLESLKSAAQPKKEEVSRLAVLQNTINAEEREIAKLTQGSKKLKEKASELQNKIENAGSEILKNQKAKVDKLQSDIDKHGTEINRHKVQIETGEKMIKKLTKGIGDSKKEQEFLHQEREKMHSTFKAIEQKAFAVQENYKKTEKLLGEHREVLDKAKSDYESLKRKMDELRATEVDADFKLKDMKKLHKEMEVKERGYNKKLDDLQNAIMKHMEQIAKDSVDQEKLKSTLEDETLSMPCNLKRP